LRRAPWTGGEARGQDAERDRALDGVGVEFFRQAQRALEGAVGALGAGGSPALAAGNSTSSNTSST